MVHCNTCSCTVDSDVVSYSTVASVDVSISDAKDQIRRLQLHLSSLHSCRNNLVPIGKLPDDILVEIFLWCKHDIVPKLHEKPVWLALLEVCHDWRHVAITTPSLWTTIQCCRIGTVAPCLTMAGSAYLDINIETSTSENDLRLWLDFVAREGHRFQTLEITDISSDEARLQSYLQPLSFPVTHLTHLVLSGSQSQVQEGTSPLDRQEQLFASSMANLRSLDVDQIMWPWSRKFYRGLPQLTKLCLTESGHAGAETSPASALEALAHLPLLQELSLQQSTHCTAADSLSQPTHVVTLTNLRSLLIEEDYATAYFLRGLCFPLSCSLTIIAGQLYTDEQGYFVERLGSRVKDASPSTLRVSFDGDHFDVKYDDARFPQSSRWVSWLAFKFKTPSRGRRCLTLIANPNVLELEIECRTPTSQVVQWRSTKVQTLKLRNLDINYVANLISDADIFPNLHTVCLSSLDNEAEVNKLKWALHHRKLSTDRAMSIEHIVIAGARDPDLTVLRGYVQDCHFI